MSAAGKTVKRVLAVPKKSPAAPKMSKMELEAHVVKLERTISRLREQAKGFKLAVAERPKAVEAVKTSAKKPGKVALRSSKPAVAAPVKASRRPARSPVQDGSTVVV